ncbi:MAG TPA: glycosyltransferase [Saprospiraceae bacterium]|nr:glycosyltransferase [Saprospiraceae bacterium]
MSGKFTHYLITRYNVPIPGFQMDRSGVTTRDEKWLQHRFELFQKFCLPSVIHQSNKDFQWLIYVDRETPEKYYIQIKEVIHHQPNIQLYQVSDHKECLLHIDQFLTQSITPFVITSRLDNDDALGLQFIQTVQKNFIEKDKVILNLLHGVGLDYRRKIVTFLYNMRNNHFTSLIELKKNEGGHITVRGFQHDEVPDDYTVINIPSRYSWLKVFHDRNVKSSTFGYPIIHRVLEERFGLQKNTLKSRIPNTVAYSFWWLADGIKRKIFRIKTK